MIPDGPGCNVQFVNATREPLVIGTPPPGFQPFGSYQMEAWFGDLETPSVLAPSGGSGSSFAQAQRGVGDEDDSADLPVSLGSVSDPGTSLFQYFAASNPDSSHFMYLTGSPGPSVPHRIVLGVVSGKTFETTAPADLQWHQLRTQTIQLGFPAALSLAIVDLDQIYDSETAGMLYNEIGAETPLSPDQSLDIYAQVIGYSFPELTVLAFELADVEFGSAQTPTPDRNAFVTSTYYTIPPGAAVTQQVAMNGSVSSSISLSSSTTWGLGVEVGFSIPLPFASIEAKVTGSFEHQSGEVAETTVDIGLSVTQEVQLQPGQWKVSMYADMVDNYTTVFTGSLRVTGTIAVPAASVAAHPLNGTVLTAIMENPARDRGSNAGPFTPGPNLTSAPVSGTMSGGFAFDSRLVVTPLPDGTGAHPTDASGTSPATSS
jgi:hypothetical protein